jgi:hypothetical protein
MILSAQQNFSDAQNVPLSSSGLVSTNVIDLGAPGTVRGGPAALIRDIGPGQPVAISINAIAAVGGTTLTVSVIQSTAANMSAPDVLLTGRTQTLASPAGKGYSFNLNFLPDQITKRYLALTYTSSAAGACTVDAGITAGKQSNVTVAAA